MVSNALYALALLAAQTQADGSHPVPVWGWVSIVGGLVTAVVTLAGFYAKARDREVAAVANNSLFMKESMRETSALLERAIEAFGTQKAGNDMTAARLQTLADVIRDLQVEIRQDLRKKADDDHHR